MILALLLGTTLNMSSKGMQKLPNNMLLKCISLVLVNFPNYLVLLTVFTWPLIPLKFAILSTENYSINFGIGLLLSAEYYVLLNKGVKELDYAKGIKSSIK